MELFERILKGVALGVIQGLTEFLPISSSGHLLLIEKLGVAPASVATNIFLHLATLLVIVVALRKEVFNVVRHPFGKRARWIYIACIPTLAISLIFKFFFEDILLGKFLSLGFLITALLLLCVSPSKFKPKKGVGAFIVGIVQGFAVLPGISRSGSTISALTFLNYEKEESATLSFLMSLPVIVGGSIFELKDINFAQTDFLILGVAFVVAFLSGLFSIKFMIKDFKVAKIPFAIYLLLLSVFNSCVDIFIVG